MTLEPQNRFTRRQIAGQGSGRVVFFVFLGIVALIGWSYIFFMSEAFMVKDVEVRGVKTLDPLEVKREVYQAMEERPRPFWQPARHVWFLNKETLEPVLKDRLFAEQVTVDKASYNVLRLIVQERARRYILRTPTQWLWIDPQGTVLQELTLKESQDANRRVLGKSVLLTLDAPIIYVNDQHLLRASEVVALRDIRAWLDIALQLQKEGIKYREIQPPINASSTQLTLKTAEGYEVWFDTSSDTLQMQIEAFRAFQKQRPKDVKVQEYVDVRIPGRVYVK